MKKGLIILVVLVMSLLVGGVYGNWTLDKTLDKTYTPATFTVKPEIKRYAIKKNQKIVSSYDSIEEAIEVAEKKERVIVIDKETGKWIYSSLQPYMIIKKNAIYDFDNFPSALKYAKKHGYEYIYFRDDNTLIWDNVGSKYEKHKLQVPLIRQLPELPRGCEVTSLAMIFKYYERPISKLELAKKVEKENTPYYRDKDGKIYYGNPYNGFVGDMYDLNKNGYGVYHGPIAQLAEKYFPDRVIDATGVEFEDLLEFIERDIPVWVITNVNYEALPEESFELWHTPTDIVKITKRMHSVVITGYDSKSIYINDPLYTRSNRIVDRNKFKGAWEQMGHQAIVIVP